MSFPVYKDLDKSVTDIFNEDFDTKYTFKAKTSGPSGLAFTTNTQYDPSKETKLITKLSLKWPHTSGFTLDKLEIASNGAVTTETSLTGTLPGVKLEFKGNDSNKGDLGVTYSSPAATITAEVDALNFSKISASATTGHGDFVAGASGEFNLTKSALGPVSLTVGYTVPQIFQLLLRSNKTFAEHSALLSYSASKDVTLVANATYGKSLAVLFGGVYKCNSDTTMKVKASSAGVLSASVKQSFDKKLSIVGTAEVPKGFDSVKLGVAATLG